MCKFTPSLQRSFVSNKPAAQASNFIISSAELNYNNCATTINSTIDTSLFTKTNRTPRNLVKRTERLDLLFILTQGLEPQSFKPITTYALYEYEELNIFATVSFLTRSYIYKNKQNQFLGKMRTTFISPLAFTAFLKRSDSINFYEIPQYYTAANTKVSRFFEYRLLYSLFSFSTRSGFKFAGIAEPQHTISTFKLFHEVFANRHKLDTLVNDKKLPEPRAIFLE